MAYQVYDYEGRPYLIWSDEDLPVEYTTIPPRSGMYYPVRFHEDTQEWEELGFPPTPPTDIPEEETPTGSSILEQKVALLSFKDIINTANIQQLEDKVSLLMSQLEDDGEGEENE